ncbi:O-antigen ligase family protein [Lapillicoccus sp.]|uniref:O-antigen ligase family protein n=1 Tax=Lapillicoccus sp. TaxID=1909287 RepID=UPI0032668EAD
MGGRWDATTVLSLFVLLLLLIPSQLVIGPLGGAGSPAQLLGVGMLGWRVVEGIRRPAPREAGSALQSLTVLIFLGAVLASYIAGAARQISDDELRSMQMGVVSVCAWLGVVFVCSDGVRTRTQLDRLLSLLTLTAGAIAVLGILQFLTGESFVDKISLPGLTINHSIGGIDQREGFQRPSGTAVHPLEFGAVLTMVLPIALHYAFHSTHQSVIRRWWPAVAIAVVVPISISRSAIVCTAVVLAFLMPTWSKAVRVRAIVAIAGLAAALYLVVPGLLGTFLGLFTTVGSDSSAQSRTGSYPLAWDFIEKAPIFGRGFLTFLPRYRILDNQYLGSLIDIGFVGVASLLAVFVTAIVVGLRIRRAVSDPVTRSLSVALSAAVAAGATSFAMFDAFSFPMAASMLFLLVGCIGALRGLYRRGQTEPAAGPTSASDAAERVTRNPTEDAVGTVRPSST